MFYICVITLLYYSLMHKPLFNHFRWSCYFLETVPAICGQYLILCCFLICVSSITAEGLCSKIRTF